MAEGSFSHGTVHTAAEDLQAALRAQPQVLALWEGLTPLGRIASFATVGLDPAIMGMGPAPASRKALERAGWKAADLDLLEINEAFAAQSLAVMQELGINPAKVNPLGGAIALGHPLGATGAIRIATVAHGLQRTGGKYGMVTMCIGTGMGAAGIIERI